MATSPATSQMTPMNRKMNGRSTIATTVPEVKNSRSDSNSRRLLAMAPVEAPLLASFIDISCSSSRLAMITSAFLPATSTK
jgi:hypothetical protein